jgi:hypothetical protein
VCEAVATGLRHLLDDTSAKAFLDEVEEGVRIPRVENGTFATAALGTAEGADLLRAALQRLKDGTPAKHDSPAWGPMTHDERVALNLRHAELHLSFFHTPK